MPFDTPLRPLVLATGLLLATAAPSFAAIVINEVDYNQPGAIDANEFIELKNTGFAPVDLGTYTIELVNGNGGGAAIYASIPLPSFLIPAGGYFVVCFGNGTNNCNYQPNTTANFVQNGPPDAIGLRNGATLVDALSYGGNTGAPYTEGVGVPVGSSDDDVNLYVGLSRFPDGTDSNNNAADFSLRCITPGVANAPPTIPCNAVVKAKPSAWGAVKALYR